jgi:hypothetical protein
LWVLPGADFGLYFFVWRPQDFPMDAKIQIFGQLRGAARRARGRG